ncbi:hypothetical protein [Rhabdothermincola salaria]|uniref:hypothetical protein n=1 Tax=Rhabdothermincola salaria TaxID=2903142 RepID=UPI001E53A53A|nr:hypothetical protein [Rhabdothermincola salaria]MCD9624295.1 hypothetical protein [Rhabdothermincola salaria]
MTVSSWDDYPVHQSSNWIAHVATSDRNFYDRYYFNAFDTGGDFMVVMGFGQYPNLQTTDAFVTVRRGGEQHIVRSSKPLEDRSDLSVGPIRVEVLEPLKRLRFVVEPTEHTVAMDITWEGFGPAIPEPNQFIRNGNRITFDTQRLAQMGSWSGSIEVDGHALAVDPSTTWGSRDRSWGVRPVGEKEPEGIYADTVRRGGMWSYFPMRFEDHCIYYICSEGADGSRSLEQAERVWLDGRIEQLGRTEHDHRFVPGMRLLSDSTISFPDAGFEIECTSLLPNFLAIGTGYGFEEDWRHGMYQGPELVVHGLVHQVDDIAMLGSYAVVDHAARFTYEGHTGHGLYEHAFSGVMPKYGLE